jgi:hypothetical protein
MIDLEGPLVSSAICLLGYFTSAQKGATSHLLDMVWLYRSPILVGVFYLLKLFLPAFAARSGGGVSTIMHVRTYCTVHDYSLKYKRILNRISYLLFYETAELTG